LSQYATGTGVYSESNAEIFAMATNQDVLDNFLQLLQRKNEAVARAIEALLDVIPDEAELPQTKVCRLDVSVGGEVQSYHQILTDDQCKRLHDAGGDAVKIMRLLDKMTGDINVQVYKCIGELMDVLTTRKPIKAKGARTQHIGCCKSDTNQCYDNKSTTDCRALNGTYCGDGTTDCQNCPGGGGLRPRRSVARLEKNRGTGGSR
jgi:hypothetical protein